MAGKFAARQNAQNSDWKQVLKYRPNISTTPLNNIYEPYTRKAEKNGKILQHISILLLL